jgi:dipeptidyl aminopeptidase/acylaminoacyl peptidase
MTRRIAHWLLAAAFFALTGTAAAQAPRPHEIEDFIREDKFREIAVSPLGTYVAAAVPAGDKTVLMVLKTGDTRPLTRVDVEGKRSHVAGIAWVSDTRLVYYIAIRDQLDERPVPTGEMWAINADGSKPVQLGGWKPDNAGMSGRSVSKEPVGMGIINTLDDSDRYVIAAVYRSGSNYTTAERVDVMSGTRLRLATAPIVFASFVSDNRGNPRFAWGSRIDGFQEVFYRDPEKDDWKQINDEKKSQKEMWPVGFSADDKTAYIMSEERTGPDAIYAYDTATGEMKLVVRDELADPSGFINAIGKRHVIGVIYGGAKPRYEYFDPESADAKAHRALQRGFPGQIVMPSTYTTAKNEVLIAAYADREPGGYYVMNVGTRKVSPMMFRADWLDPHRLGQSRDLTFKARDGRTIPVLLTLPPGSDGKNLPMVVHPHGGPFGVIDSWGFDPTVQVMASHGYAVLQVNFRGSGGFGREHERSGYKQWGLSMQDDVTDATRWAIAEGYADRSRVCIFGASYGGYASLMGVAKEPDLYRCAVGQVGVYDMGKFKFDDAMRGDFFRRYHEEATNDGDLGPVSPARIAERIKVPVFLTTGKEDARVPYEHTEMMEAALKKAGVPVETLYFKTEGHGIYKLEHRRQFYAQLLNFLHRHIGGRAPVVVATASDKK